MFKSRFFRWIRYFAQSDRLRRPRRQRTHRPALEPLESRLAPAIVHWNVDVDGFWDVASNWENNHIPTAGDTAVLNRPAGIFTITVRDSESADAVQNSEVLKIIGGGRLSIEATSSLGGNVQLVGGELSAQASGPITLSAATAWTGGVLSSNGQGFLNTGTVTLSGANDGVLTGLLVNSGHIVETGTGDFVVDNTFTNNGLVDLQSDAGIAGNGVINNRSTIQKSAGSGVSRVGPSANVDLYLNQLGGTLDAQNGTLRMDGLRTSILETGGTWNAETGATLDFVGAQFNTYFAGSFTGSGTGTVQLSGGSFIIDSGGATFNFPAGLLHWTGGSIGGQPLTNAGVITLSGSTDVSFNNTFNNDGKIIETGTGNLVVSGTLNNNASGLIDFQSDAGIAGNGIINNRGTIQKSAGSGVSRVGQSANVDLYFNQLGGTLDAQNGTLRMDGLRTSLLETGGTWNAETGATLDFVGAQFNTYFAGSFTGSGTGTVQLSGGSFIIDSGGATFNFPAGLLHWTGGSIGGQPLTNAGVITLSGSTDVSFNNTFNNDGKIIETGTGNLVVSGTLNNNASGLIDFQSDAGIAGNGVINNRGTIQKSAGSGVSRVGPSANADLYFNQAGGKLDAQAGILRLDGTRTQSGVSAGGTWDAETGATLDIVGNGPSGTFLAGTFAGAGGGQVLLDGGSFVTDTGGATFNFPMGLLQWVGGNLFSSSQNPFTNANVLTLSGSSDKGLANLLVNQGTLIQTGTGNLQMFSAGTIDNRAGARYDIQSDAGIIGGSGTFINSGTLRKSGGTGASLLTPPVPNPGNSSFHFNNNGGTIDAESGRLNIAGGGLWQDAALLAGAGAVLEISGGPAMTGLFTGSGAGRLEISGGLSPTDNGVPGALATLNFPLDFAHWTGGEIDGNRPLVNAGFLTIDGANSKFVYRNTIVNTGTMIDAGPGDLILNGSGDFAGSTLDNRAGAVFELRGDNNIVQSQANAGVFINAGTLLKTAGNNVSVIAENFNSTSSGVVDVQTGTVQLRRGGFSTGGTFNVAAGAVLEFALSGDIFHAVGSYTGSGAGVINFKGLLYGDDDSAPSILNFAPGYFHMLSGQWLGSLENDGAIALDGAVFARTHFINVGTITHTGGDLELNANTFFENRGLYDIQADVNVDVPGDASGGNMQFLNTGVIRKSAGTGTTQLRHGGSGKAFLLNNPGTVEVQTGTLDIADLTSQVSGTTLTGGTWIVHDGATLSFPAGTNITTNQGNVTLDGPTAAFPAIAGLASNQGTLDFTNGNNFSTAGSFTNNGTLSVGPGSTVTVNGNLTEAAPCSVQIEIAGHPASGQFGQVHVTGMATLAGSLAIQLAPGFGPTQGDVYSIVTYTSKQGGFGAVGGLHPFFTANVGAQSVQLTAGASAANLAVQSITVPGPSTIGQMASIPFSVQNTTTTAISGNWTDSVYLSRGATFGSDAVLFARLPHTGGLAAMTSYPATATVVIPDVIDGDYHVIVVADTSQQVPDTNRADNVMISANTFHISVPTLTLGSVTTGTIADGQDQLYRVDVPAGAGDLVLAASFAVGHEADLFVAYNALPGSASADASFTSQPATRTQPLIANPQAGAYYVLVHGREGAPAPQMFSLTPRLAQFEIRDVTPNHGSNAGSVTITVLGSGFTQTSTVSLVSGSTNRAASAVMFQDNNTLFATFDLTGLAPGAFDVRIDNGAQHTTDTGAFAVESGIGGLLQYRLDGPVALRAGAVTSLTITYANVGDTDVPAPLMELSSTNAQYRLSDQDPWQAASIQLLGINPSGPAGVLPPGFSGTITVQVKPITVGAHVDIPSTLGVLKDPSQIIDWASLKDTIKPPTLSADAWNVVFPNFVALVGNTVGSYQAAMDAAATYLSLLGAYTSDLGRLRTLEFNIADNFGTMSQRNTLGQFGWGVFGPSDVHVLSAPEGNVAICAGNVIRLFVPDATGSTFHGLAGDPATATLRGAFDTFVVREPDGSMETYSVTFNNAGAVTSGRLAVTTDPNGNATTFTAGGFSDAFGNTVSYFTDAQGNVIVTDPVGRTTTFAFDAARNLIGITDAAGTTSLTYVPGGALATAHAVQSITLPDGSHQFFAYDALGRLKATHGDNNADSLTYTYDAVGNVTVTDASGAQLVVSANDVRQIARVQDALGTIVSGLFDAGHGLNQLTASTGASLTVAHDSLGNPTDITGPLGSTIGASYNPGTDTLTNLTDPRGITTTYSSDSHGNLKTLTYTDGTTEQYRYDPVGNLIASTDRLGKTTQYAYDSHNLLKSVTYSDGSTVAYTYDVHRNLASAADASGTTTFSYDAADRLVQVTYPDGKFVTYQYNALGQRSQMSDQDGFTVKYGYDPLGRLAGLTDGTGAAIVSYTYDLVGRLSTVTMANGTVTTYGYDAASNTTSVANTRADHSVISNFVYTYDDAGRPLTMTTLGGTMTYGYDADGQLTSVALPGGRTIAYQYDASGNRTMVIDGGTSTAYGVNNLDEYTDVGATRYTYDLDGQLSTKTDASGTTTYHYDVVGRLVSVTSSTDMWTYRYDALGNLAATTHNGQETQNLIDPTGLGNVIAQYNGGGLVANYTYGLGLTSQVSGAGSAYYAFDANGNTANLTAANGALLNSYAYLPFGESLSTTGSRFNPFTVVGQAGVMTDGSGLQFMRNRFYDAAVGRFTQPDPIGLAGGDVNLYRYVGNAPVSFIDPSGETYADDAARAIANGLKTLYDSAQAAAASPVGQAIAKTGTEFVESEVEAQVTTASASVVGSVIGPEGTVVAGTTTEIIGQGKTVVRVAKAAGNVVRAVSKTEAVRKTSTYIRSVFPLVLSAVSSAGAEESPWGRRGAEIGPNQLQAIIKYHQDQRTPGDPNDISGPAGFGAQSFVAPSGVYPYRIDFENVPTASAPAAVVKVTQQLDANLDWNTFQLDSFGIGGQTVDVPAGLTAYRTRVDLRSTVGVYVDVSADFDPTTGLVTWLFTSIDPATGDLPADVLTGFLPPDTNDPQGTAYVSYTVLPKASLVTGDMVPAKGTVIFDAGLPDQSSLDTATILNTIDAGAPTSTVDALPASSGTTFDVSWHGTDDAGGSGIAAFDIFVSDNGKPFTPFLLGTTQTTASFTGGAGHTYGFYSVATDNVGNVEPTPSAAQATTQIGPSLPPGYSYEPSTKILTITGSQFLFSQSTSAGGLHNTFLFDIDGSQAGFSDTQIDHVVVNGTPGMANAAVLCTGDTYLDASGQTQETTEFVTLGGQRGLAAGGGQIQRYASDGALHTFLTLNNFPISYAYTGHADIGQLVGSQNNLNTFVTAGSYAYIYSNVSPGEFHYIGGAAEVVSVAALQGDFAFHYDGSGASAFVASGTAYSFMVGTDFGHSFFNEAIGYRYNQAIATHGGDIAFFYDSPLSDTFTAFPGLSAMYSDDANGIRVEYDSAQGFSMVSAYSFVGGMDIAYNNDPNHNTVVGFLLLGS